MNLITRDFFYNRICSSPLISNKIRTLLYKWGGGKTR